MARDVIAHDVDLPSLEYDDEETAYMATETPSFDPDDASLGSTFVILDEDPVSDPEDDYDDVAPLVTGSVNRTLASATDPLSSNSPAAGKTKFLDRIKEHKSYQKLARIVKKKGEEPPVIMSPDSGINELQGLSLEEQEKQKEEWQQELNKVEEEIKTLREVLGSKVKASQELRRKLGYTVWQEISEDVSQSLRNVKESNVYQNVEDKFTQIGKAVVDAPIFNFSLPDSGDMRTPTRNMVLKHCYQNVEGKVKQFGTAVAETPIYQKTESVVKTTAEKATTIFGGFGSGLTTKLGQIKNSESFRSFEEKVGSALENVKTKVASRSNSMQNFDEILEEETRLANEEKRTREEREAATK
ncbi:tumor protein D52 isoform X1 [Sipha flava]|uniref:Tumor protein D52 isoform X1 n=1 Tax=Sipha flava TaxID=143950 RepID=A0A8B8FZX3_9HEMI|nr:tumor protein D52 isoform X1 [Sipha flava]